MPKEAEGKIVIVATIMPLADWASSVGGDAVYVQTLLPAGASPHTFDPTPRDMRMLANAGLLVKVGLQMDDWGASLAKSAGRNGPAVLSLGDSLQKSGKLPDVGHFDHDLEVIEGDAGTDTESHDGHNHDGDHSHNHDHDHGGINPHFWLDPKLAMESVYLIRDQLMKIAPDSAEVFRQNADKTIARLQHLDQDIAAGLKPYAGRSFVSFHNAWPYFAARYDLKIAAVIEEYPGKAPGEKYLRAVTDRLKALQIKTIFTEPQLNPRVAEVIAGEIGAKVGLLDPYGTATDPHRNSYEGVMRYNLQQLEAAFSK